MNAKPEALEAEARERQVAAGEQHGRGQEKQLSATRREAMKGKAAEQAATVSATWREREKGKAAEDLGAKLRQGPGNPPTREALP